VLSKSNSVANDGDRLLNDFDCVFMQKIKQKLLKVKQTTTFDDCSNQSC
jgi:hypothetical protein